MRKIRASEHDYPRSSRQQHGEVKTADDGYFLPRHARLADLVVVEMKTKTPNLFVAAQGCRTSVT